MRKPWKANTSAGSSPETAGSPHRARSTDPASIRGRISSPIPIPSPMDDEFPMRQPGTGMAQPLDAPENKGSGVDTPALERGKRSPAPPTVSSSPAPVAQDAARDVETVTPPPPEPRPGPVSRNSPRRRTNMSSTLRFSTVSQDTTAQTGSSKEQPQRKKSVLRGAFGKLFGRKKKNKGSQSSPIPEGRPAQAAPNQHHSDPTALNRSCEKVEANRSASLPVTEFDRALRSHSVGPEDVMAIESARNSLSADLSLSKARSAGTGPHSGGLRRTGDGGLTGLSPRPASTHGRGSEPVYTNDDPEQIGRAITSDFSGLNRRSRSLSGLPAAEDNQANPRRRSDEIRYWRGSHGQLTSPVSSNPPECEDPAAVTFDIPESVADVPPKTPPQPFTFGDIASMNEMAGMKITHAANMETRIGSLEARTRRLEKVVTQLCNAVPDFRPHVDAAHDRGPPAPPTGESHATQTTSAPLGSFAYRISGQDHTGGSTRPSTRHSEKSKLSSADAPTYVGSFSRPAIPPAFESRRPVSTATVRAAASLPTLSREMAAPFTFDHYMTLMALVETERSARLALEAEVRRLGHQVNLVARTSTYARNTLGGGPSLGDTTSAFDEDDDEDDGEQAAPTTTKPQRGSVLIPEDSGIGAGLEGDEISEAFATPREEGRPFSPPGAPDLEADDEAKKAARTLSLSQLTYNATHPGVRSEGVPQPI